MFEDLKELLGMLDGIADLGIWILIGYVAYLLIVYLSTTGAIVYCIKLIVEKLYDALTHEKVIKWELEELTPVDDKVKNHIIESLKIVKVERDPALHCLHHSGAKWLREAIEEKITRDNAKEQ